MSRVKGYARKRSLSDSKKDFVYVAKKPKFVKKSKANTSAAADSKYVDTGSVDGSTQYDFNTSGSITHISVIPVGNGVTEREGRSATLTSVRVRGFVTPSSGTVIGVFSWAVVYDNQPNKALPAVTDIYESANANAFPKRENADRFKIVREWRNSANGSGADTVNVYPTLIVDEYIKLPKDCTVSYTNGDTTGVIGNCITGALYFVCRGTIASGVTDGFGNLAIRVNFRDPK